MIGGESSGLDSFQIYFWVLQDLSYSFPEGWHYPSCGPDGQENGGQGKRNPRVQSVQQGNVAMSPLTEDLFWTKFVGLFWINHS